MSNHQILDSATHRDLRVRTDAAAELGDGTMACITVPSEFRRVQNEFPILFRRDLERGTFSALALMGFENGENLFLEDGRWLARYKPLALAIQPFLVGRAPGGDGPGQVHIDLGHPRIAAGEDGVRLFDELGRPTPFLEKVTGRLGDLDQGYRESTDFFAALERCELLEPFSLDIELDDGSQHRMVGYHIVDEDKLRALGPAELDELHRDGHLLPVFMALASLSNISGLVERKNRRNADG
jgi:hypothetical protein